MLFFKIEKFNSMHPSGGDTAYCSTTLHFHLIDKNMNKIFYKNDFQQIVATFMWE